MLLCTAALGFAIGGGGGNCLGFFTIFGGVNFVTSALGGGGGGGKGLPALSLRGGGGGGL